MKYIEYIHSQIVTSWIFQVYQNGTKTALHKMELDSENCKQESFLARMFGETSDSHVS